MPIDPYFQRDNNNKNIQNRLNNSRYYLSMFLEYFIKVKCNCLFAFQLYHVLF